MGWSLSKEELQQAENEKVQEQLNAKKLENATAEVNKGMVNVTLREPRIEQNGMKYGDQQFDCDGPEEATEHAHRIKATYKEAIELTSGHQAIRNT